MTGQVISLGWFLPRNADSEEIAKQYGRLLHLPLLRGYADAWLFWAGETVVFEPKSDGAPDWRYPDWRTSPTLPVFRTPNLTALLSRLRRDGAEIIVEEVGEYGTIAVMKDLDDHFVLFRQTPMDSDLYNEALARERAETVAHERYNPGTAPMPTDIQGIDCIIRHVADLQTLGKFYADVVGLKKLVDEKRLALFDCGDGTTIELRAGGQVEPVPKDRMERPDTFILRVDDFDAFQAKITEKGAQLVNERIRFGRGCLGYFCDPEGHLIGYEERYPQDRSDGTWVGFEEDLEGHRRGLAGAS